MYQEVPQRDYRRPGDLGMLSADLFRETSSCFTDQLEMAENPDLDEFVTLEGCPPASRVPVDPVDGIENIDQPLAIIPHRATASRRIGSLT
jgi:hypothetical protein